MHRGMAFKAHHTNAVYAAPGIAHRQIDPARVAGMRRKGRWLHDALSLDSPPSETMVKP